MGIFKKTSKQIASSWRSLEAEIFLSKGLKLPEKFDLQRIPLTKIK